MNSEPAKDVRWNLNDLYASADHPQIAADLKAASNKAVQFERNYKPLLEELAGGENPRLDLAALLRDYKEIMTLCAKPHVYAHLYFAEKTDEPARGSFLQKMSEVVTEIQTRLVFWDVLWCRLDETRAEALISEPGMEADRHYLRNLRKYAPHVLSEPEEKVLSLKHNTSGGAFTRLFDETVNQIPFFITLNGRKIQKTEAEVLALLHSPDRNTRKASADSLAEGLKNNSRLLTYTYNMILADHRLSMKLRRYRHPMDSRNLSNETDLATVQGLIQSVRDAYPLLQRYYHLKQKLLKLETFYDYDRYAPVRTKEAKVGFDECGRAVLSAYETFSPEAAGIAGEFFRKRWIDAEIRPGKQGGGFCCDTTPELHSYILVNYTGSIRDVLTVAHEIGHGIHQQLSRKAGILEMNAPLILAETASVFGEMLVFDRLLKEEKDPAARLALLCAKIDDNFATVSRQIALTVFELAAHEEGLQQGELSEERFNEIWMTTNAGMYGQSVVLTDNFRHGWKYIPHFVHTPFYCYAYAFAQLFVLTLYQKYKEKPEGFAPDYLRMLTLGGSRTPEEISGVMGLNFREDGFWQKGLTLLKNLVAEAETLSGTSGGATLKLSDGV